MVCSVGVTQMALASQRKTKTYNKVQEERGEQRKPLKAGEKKIAG